MQIGLWKFQRRACDKTNKGARPKSVHQEETMNDRVGADKYVLRNLIDRHASERGDKEFVLFSDDQSWTYARLRRNVRRVAASLQALGVKQDDFVLSWLPNGPHALAVWFALNYIGAVYVPVNISYRGRLLAHVIKNSGARLMIADARLVERLAEVDRAALDTLVVISGA